MKKIKNIKLSLYYKILICLSLFCALLYFIFTKSADVSEFFTRHISSVFRIVLGLFSSFFPFSFAEILIFSFVLFFLFLLGYCIFSTIVILKGKTPKISAVKLLSVSLSIALIIFDLFVFTFAPSYYRHSLKTNMDLNDEIKKEHVISTLELLKDNLNELCDKVTFDESGASKFEGSYGSLFNTVKSASDKLAEKHSFLQNTGFPAKPLLISPLMTYTHISGIFTFFTGEANVNTNYPDYIVAFSAAHEHAHARSVGPENEANFVAFLTCIESEDAYLQYSGYAYVFSTVANAVKNFDKDAYNRILSQLDDRVFGEYKAYSEFFEKYKDSVAADVSNAVNDAYLNMHGQSGGIKTYGYFTDMIVLYFLNTKAI